jgi:hypothetical protein
MNQHSFVKERLTYYEEQGLVPGNPDDGDWQEAHYPEPRGVGKEVVWMLYNDHQQQGLYQSEEYGRPCFFNADVKTFLDNNWCSNWFELYDLYDKWSGHNGRVTGPTSGKSNITKIPKEVLVANGKANAVALNDHENTKKQQKANGKATVASMNDHVNTRKSRVVNGKSFAAANLRPHCSANGKSNAGANLLPNCSDNAKAVNNQKWQCLVTGYVSNPGGLSTYQKARGIDTNLRVKLP